MTPESLGSLRSKRLFVFILVGVVVLWPAMLWAHARLTRSEPAASARLAVTPTAIRLWFSEAPEVSLSRVTLKDSAGTAVPLGVVSGDSSKLGIEARIGRALVPGAYTVNWLIAGRDGHPITGAYTFLVLEPTEISADTIPTAALLPIATSDSSTEPSAEALSFVATRFATFVGLLLLIGTAAFKFGVLDRVSLDTRTQLAAHARLTRVAALGAVVLLVAAAARLQLQRELLSDPSHLVHLRNLATHSGWGRAWLLQVAAALVIAAAAWSGRRGSRAAWIVAALASVAAALSATLSGHAVASTTARELGITADVIHILGASGWLGGLACLLIVGLPATAHAEEGRWQGLASLVNAFSPMALACAGLVLVTGIGTAALRLGALTPLWTSAYGQMLLIKIGLLIIVAGAGAYNWLRVKPTLGTSESAARLRTSATMELAVGVAVIAATAVLVALPTPSA